jgi:LruC domain-containing protein
MKKIIASVFAAAFIGMGLASAQSVDLNAEKLIDVDRANCWGLGAQSYTKTAGQVISGTASVRSNQLTSMLPGASWVKSPFIRLSGANITFKCRLDGNPGTTRSIKVFLIPVDESNAAYKEGTPVEIWNFSFPKATTQTLYSHSVPVPAQYLSLGGNYKGVYKVQVSWLGTGGTGRMLSDDFVVPGEYYALPSQNCWPKKTIQDRDNDGVEDANDEYPDDATRAYNSYYPGKGVFGTLLFEDLWPFKGDFDFNDVVVDYNITHVSNAANKLVESKITTTTRATGASYKDGFAIQYLGLDNAKVASVTNNTITGATHVIGSNGVESGVTNGATIVIFDNAKKVLTETVGTGINTSLSAPKVPTVTKTATITYTKNLVTLADVSADKFNPFIVVNQNRKVEVHLADKAPTNLADASQFGTKDDKSSAGSGTYYRTAGNLPFALNIPVSSGYAIEKTDLTKAYPKLIDWALSKGTSFTDWYKAANAVPTNIYSK